jgi:hypothetical protein
VHRSCTAFMYGVVLPWLALHRAGSSECTACVLLSLTVLHWLGSLCTARRVLRVHRLCTVFLYGVALPWLALHHSGSLECTAHALPFCSALHYLGSLCTAEGPRSAQPVHCLFVRHCSALDRFAPHEILAVHRMGFLFFVSRCTSLDRVCTARVLAVHCSRCTVFFFFNDAG